MLFPNWTRLMSRRIRRSSRPMSVAAIELLERRTVPTVSVTGSSTVTIVISADESVTVSDDGDGHLRLTIITDPTGTSPVTDERNFDGVDTVGDVPVVDGGTLLPVIDPNFIQSLTIKATASGRSGTGSANNVIDLSGMSEDVFVLLSSLTVKAGGGDDIITGSPLTTLNEALFGGQGADEIDGGLGSDILNGEDGDDILTGGDGAGDDGDDTILGGAGNDVITGGEGNDNVKGQIGNDSIDGEAGDDRIDGGDGNDTVSGGDGNDNVLAGKGDDVVRGDDAAAVAPGDDTIDGGAGFDVLRGEEGNDSINGGDGDDLIGGGLDDDTLSGGNGNDRVFGDDGDDVIGGNAGNDTLLGGNDDDSVLGGAGNDIIAGQSGIDTVNGQGGSDIVAGGSGGDSGTIDAGDLVIGATSEIKETTRLVFGANIGWTDLVDEDAV